MSTAQSETWFAPDKQGFLIGELIETEQALLAVQRRGNKTLQGLRSNVSSLAPKLGVARQTAGSTAVATPFGRGSSRVASSRGEAAVPGNWTQCNARPAVSRAGRDSRGRFTTAGQRTGVGAERGGGSRASHDRESAAPVTPLDKSLAEY